MKARRASRQSREHAGRRAEVWAALMLRLRGFRIIVQRYRTHVGEIDLIAKRGRLLIFVEVKQRASHDAALEAITPMQMRRIAQAARQFLSQEPRYASFDMRIDVVTCAPWSLPRLHRDAMTTDGTF